MSVHVIRYDGVDYPVTPEILAEVFRGVNRAATRQDGPSFVQRLDEISDGTSVMFVLGLGAGLTFATTTALARELVADSNALSASPMVGDAEPGPEDGPF